MPEGRRIAKFDVHQTNPLFGVSWQRVVEMAAWQARQVGGDAVVLDAWFRLTPSDDRFRVNGSVYREEER
jgi:hypothetical protein